MHHFVQSALLSLLEIRRRRCLLRCLLRKSTDCLPRSAKYKHTSTDSLTPFIEWHIETNALQWFDLSQKDVRSPPDLTLHPSHRNHRFFDSKGPGGVTTPRPSSFEETYAHGGQVLEIDKNHIVQYAHFGYVYCMLISEGIDDDDEVLVSGGGDGTIKLWTLAGDTNGTIADPISLENGDESVLTLALDGTILYSGRLDGEINVWDLDTRQLIRRVKPDNVDVLTLSIGHGFIFSGGANGLTRVSALIRLGLEYP